ncbi:PREDICTED: uncharacterized protein LOC102017623 [Chinchilla lanigera]|uniref:uncharacterized protein LOC102017623 n=1 Tax=Chinchilla lanigera TaxID=34839 RepID=UPI00038EF61A|nr:PREDICTED: uncharacterized protein LOC102017623 [Chinchilla lanigera]
MQGTRALIAALATGARRPRPTFPPDNLPQPLLRTQHQVAMGTELGSRASVGLRWPCCSRVGGSRTEPGDRDGAAPLPRGTGQARLGRKRGRSGSHAWRHPVLHLQTERSSGPHIPCLCLFFTKSSTSQPGGRCSSTRLTLRLASRRQHRPGTVGAVLAGRQGSPEAAGRKFRLLGPGFVLPLAPGLGWPEVTIAPLQGALRVETLLAVPQKRKLRRPHAGTIWESVRSRPSSQHPPHPQISGGGHCPHGDKASSEWRTQARGVQLQLSILSEAVREAPALRTWPGCSRHLRHSPRLGGEPSGQSWKGTGPKCSAD